MLKIENISKKFAGNDFYSLKDVSMEINKGEIVEIYTYEVNGKVIKAYFRCYYIQWYRY